MFLCIPGRGFILNSEGHPGKILRKDMTTLAQVWSVLSYSNLAPTSHTSELTVDRARLIFGLVSCLDMNIGALISSQMTSIAQSNTSRLGFPALIIALCRATGVVSDNLTFERLSLVINLAYIRKNCWNPEDLTVVAPPGSIPSVEQFREMVVWPGTQPSLHREDEGPTAQVPQHVEDESSEATIPEPFVIGEEAKETHMRQVAAATLERSLEATLEPSAQGEDIPSPQPAADPSTPILEMPEDLTTPVLAMDTSPPATLVLHLIDEEDVQTQDTQDQLIRQALKSVIFHLLAKPIHWFSERPLSATLIG
ncbi:hypothetical protein GmHk_01G000877 [Glycine max]|nr:hypothetical protein GmHk_01G000877 [Glycine max]